MLLAVLTVQPGCATTKKALPEAGSLTIRKAGVLPKTFIPEKGEKAAIRWSQSRQAVTAVEIHRENGELIRHFEKFYPAGDHTVQWDGKDDAAQPVGPDVYLYTIRSRDKEGNETSHDPSLTTGGEELKVERFTFDKEKHRFDFIMPRAGRARLRIGLSPNPHLRTLLNWEPLEGGTHTLEWDGLDESGWIRAIDHPNLSIYLVAFALPDNAIIAEGTRKETVPVSSTQPPRDPQRDLYLHAAHDRANCRDMTVNVDFPNATKDAEGIPILDEKTTVRVRLNDSDRSFMVNQRFEVMFYVDSVFLFEEEDGQDPFNFEWNTNGLAPGEHLLTVNLIGYEDHYGVKTLRVVKR